MNLAFESNPELYRAAMDGAVTLGYAVAALFFRRFWQRTKDRLFAWFAWAFVLLSINRLIMTLLDLTKEEATPAYLVRVLAFLMILYAIWDKNRGEPTNGR